MAREKYSSAPLRSLLDCWLKTNVIARMEEERQLKDSNLDVHMKEVHKIVKEVHKKHSSPQRSLFPQAAIQEFAL